MKNLLWITFLLLFAAPLAAQTAAPDSLSTKVPEGFVLVKGGTFQMGSTTGDPDEQPAHTVTVGDFYLAKHEVTFEAYERFCAATNHPKPDDYGMGRGQHPVINVSWYDAVAYCNWRSLLEHRVPVYSIDTSRKDPDNTSARDPLKWVVTLDSAANGYRLPTEAEWEYAAREGGKNVMFGNGKNLVDPYEVNFNAGNRKKEPYSVVGEVRNVTVPVSDLPANALGIKNMSGNVQEWCQDWYDRFYYGSTEGASNPQGASRGYQRVLRGGSWREGPKRCRAVDREYHYPSTTLIDTGFRLAASLK